MASFTELPSGKVRAFVKVNNRRKTKVCKTKKEAKLWATRMESAMAQPTSIVTHRWTVGDALERYLEEVSPHKRSYKWESLRVNTWRKEDFWDVRLSELTPEDVARFRDRRLGEVKSSTVNRELNFLSSVLTRAVQEWRWLELNPVKNIKRPSNPQHRVRRVSDTEIMEISRVLGYSGFEDIYTKSQEVAVLFQLAIETGMRLSEMTGLKVADVYDDYVVLPRTKNGDRREVPLNSKARGLLSEVVNQKNEYVFTVSSAVAGALFRKALKKLGIKDLHFHDSRHEATVRLSKKVDVLMLARILGHRDLRSLQVYYYMSAAEISKQLD